MNFTKFVPVSILNLIPPHAWGKINVMKAFVEARKRLLGIVAILVLILLMMNLNSRLSEYFRLDSERNKMSTQMAQLEMTHAVLETQVAYATSDAAVEDWARDEAHLAREGDKVVVVLTPVGDVATQQVVVTPEPRSVQNWEVWWALFFGR
jgi:cell division protein FtsB